MSTNMGSTLSGALDWKFLNEPAWAWGVFIIALTLFLWIWGRVLNIFERAV